MKLIKYQNAAFCKVAGEQQMSADGIYRLLTYCIAENVDDGVLLFNTLSSEMVLLSSQEQERMLTNDYLREHWFIVPSAFDDKQFARQYHSVRMLLQPKSKGINGYTIMTTTDCNARCFYCYELGRRRIPMSESTAAKVAEYIIANYHRLKPEDRHDVHISWFGGEPLYNNKVIDSICRKLTDEAIPFRSSMISNAYLFDAELIERAKTLWQLKRVQVTLDGTESTYNRSKNFIYRDGSAYQRVLHNISLLLNASIKVNIRLNMDLHNAEDLLVLADELHSRFADEENLAVYCHPLFETAGHKEHIRSNENRAKVYEYQLKLETILEAYGLLKTKGLPGDITFTKCMADSGHSRMIAPTGDIGLCEHYSESEFCSHVDTPEQEEHEVIASFRERYPDETLCDTCAYYPLCIRLKKCEEDKFCFPEVKELHLMRTRRSMVQAYNKYLEKHGANECIENEEESDELNVEC